MVRTLLAAALVAASLGSVGLEAQAATPVGVSINVAPPPPRAEAVPAPRRGYVWSPGYWSWNGRRHVWVAGSWMRERRGYAYAQPEWTQRDGRWEMRRGEWRRGDRDGDGVPNRLDRRPNNPNRR